MTDLDLFAWIVARMHEGWNYYDAMGYALRHGPGPAASVFNWRPPLLYVGLSYLPWSIPAAWWGVLMTEVWAGLAIAGSSLTAKRAPQTSLLLACLAVLLRELALPYLLIRCCLEWKTRRGFCGFVLGAVVAYYAGHWGQVWAHQLPTDILGPPWIVFGGWRFVRMTITPNPFTMLFGSQFGAWLWLACLSAVITVPSFPLADRCTLAAYLLAFLVAGRAEPTFNSAPWGFVTLPLQALLIWQGAIKLALYQPVKPQKE